MFSRVVGDLHHVEFEPLVTLADAVDASDVRTGFVHRPHQLGGEEKNNSLERFHEHVRLNFKSFPAINLEIIARKTSPTAQ